MTMRETIYTLLTTDTELATLGIAIGSVWNIEAVDNPDRGTPFVVTAWAEQPRTAGNGWATTHRRDVLIWAHDTGGDYSRIDRILERVRILLVDLIHEGGISQVDYSGASPDLYDDGFRTITRNYGFRVIGTD